ncbi:MAG: hypothetical protein F4X92_06840 [Gammaproteobacteria bacterium]|nr:hypothetical protein [Gammaproteobacteria bacterium]
MCIIVDANRMGGFLKEPYGEDATPIHKWLKKSGHLIYSTGGSFTDEVGKKAMQKLMSYAQAGRASVISSKCFENFEKELRSNPEVQSDDHHILALAQYSGARVLFTGDSRLMNDFRNKNLIDNPRGKIYSDCRQATLLNQSACRRT